MTRLKNAPWNNPNLDLFTTDHNQIATFDPTSSFRRIAPLHNTMSPPLEINPEEEEDDYVSEEDSDFAPDAENAAEADDGDELSASDNEGNAISAPKTAQKRPAEDQIDSGDEAIIEKAKKRQKKKAKNGQDKDEDEGGEGGLVKTRSMRAAEYVSPIIFEGLSRPDDIVFSC